MRLIKRAILMLIVLSFFAACPPVVEQPKTAQELVDDGKTAMKDGDWEQALTNFSEALIIDPDNSEAVIGYSMVNLASIASDSETVDLMRNELGMVEYPDSMRDVFLPATWMQDYVTVYEFHDENDEVNDTYTYHNYFPKIVNQDDFDGIGISGPANDKIEYQEAMVAFIANLMQNSIGFTSAIEKILPVFKSRLDKTITVLKTASNSMNFTVSWDMISDQKPDYYSSTWPLYDENGNPKDITIGKAEVLAMAAVLQAYESFMHLAQAYDFSLPLQEYWDVYNPEDGTLDPSELDKPFTNFLSLTDQASTAYANTKATLASGLNNMAQALSLVLSNRQGFTYSSDSTVGILEAEFWDDYYVPQMDFQKRIYEELANSAENNTVAYIPTSYPADPWPTSAVTGESVAINIGAFLDVPFDIFAALGNLNSDGEPIFYVYDKENAQLNILDEQVFLGAYPGYDMQTNSVELQYFYYIPDVTFNGSIPIDTYPIDDPETRLEIEDLSFSDDNGNGSWDPGEYVNNIHFWVAREGYISLSNLSEYPDNDPFSYYNFYISSLFDNTLSERLDMISDEALLDYTSYENLSEFRSVILNVSKWGMSYGALSSFIIDTVNRGLYIPVPLSPEAAFHLITPEGTNGVDTSGNSITSLSSFYWFIFDFFHRGFSGEFNNIEEE